MPYKQNLELAMPGGIYSEANEGKNVLSERTGSDKKTKSHCFQRAFVLGVGSDSYRNEPALALGRTGF